MAVRPIDAYQAIDIIDEWLDSVGTVMVGKGLSSYGELIGCVEDAPTLTPPNEWVSVEDTVPDPGERVLATDGTFVGEAYRTSANSWYRHTGFPWRDCLQSIVTHWMPLPKSPKEDE